MLLETREHRPHTPSPPPSVYKVTAAVLNSTRPIKWQQHYSGKQVPVLVNVLALILGQSAHRTKKQPNFAQMSTWRFFSFCRFDSVVKALFDGVSLGKQPTGQIAKIAGSLWSRRPKFHHQLALVSPTDVGPSTD